MNDINDYLKVDPRWGIFGMSDSTSFLQNMMLKDEFVDTVPQDIKKSFVTVQHLIAHSYYYYELYDEAFKKMLSIYEMAIKHRYIQLKTELSADSDIDGIKLPVLHAMIKRICKEKQFAGFEDRMLEVKQKRNLAAHPKDYGFLGIILKSSMIGVINMINLLFISPDSIALWNASSSILSARFAPFSSGACLLKIGGNEHLVDGMAMEAMLVIDKKEIALCSCIVVNKSTVDNLKQHKIQNPIVMLVTELHICADHITGIHMDSGLGFRLERTTSKEELKIWKRYKEEFDATELRLKFMYASVHSSHTSEQVEAFIHRHGRASFN